MKPRQLTAMLVLVSIAVLPFLPNVTAVASSSSGPDYSERLVINTAGSNALWYLTLAGVNASASPIVNVEAISGLTSYNVTAIKTTSWDSDFQVFGPHGYDLIRLPFIPDQGLFLEIKASDPTAAASAVSVFDSYLAAAFIPTSNSSGTYDYFSPVSFSLIVPGTLLRLIPRSAGGYASLVSAAQFIELASPFVSLSGQKSSGDFLHTLTLGSIKQGAVVSGALQLLSLFGSNPTSIQPSKLAASSTIYLRSLDGIISSKDNATVRNNGGNFSGSYLLHQTSRVKALNLTLLQSPLVVVPTRILDKGAVSSGAALSVTLSVKNIGSQPLVNLSVNDGWWRSYPAFFSLSSGDSNFTISSIDAGKEESRTYVLKVGNSTGEVTIPSVTGRYFYRIGGTTHNGTAVFNEAHVVVGMVEPALSIAVQPSGASGNPLGTPENFTITVKNDGNGPALDVVVANSTKESLAQGSQPWVVGVPIKFTSITQSNISRFFTVSWRTPEGATRTVRSSLSTLFFTHSSMEIGFSRVIVNGTVTPLLSTSMNVTLKYSTSNGGHAPVANISASESLPPGVQCGRTSGANITCANGVVSLNYAKLTTGATKEASISFTVNRSSLIFVPARFSVSTGGFVFEGMSGGFPAPAGLVATRTLSPSALFSGMSPTAIVTASNEGGYSFYNATVFSSSDDFDKLPTPEPLHERTLSELKPGSSSSFNYTLIVTRNSSGVFKTAGVDILLLFGGRSFEFSVPQGNATIFRSVEASLSSSPKNPLEGSNFVAHLSVSNPSPVQVSNVHLALTLPPGLRVVSLVNANLTNGAVTLDLPSLGAGNTYSANLTLSAGSGLTLSLPSSLSFAYSGQQLKASLPRQSVTVSEDVLTRYGLPVAVAILAALAATIVIRRRLVPPPTSPSSPQ